MFGVVGWVESDPSPYQVTPFDMVIAGSVLISVGDQKEEPTFAVYLSRGRIEKRGR